MEKVVEKAGEEGRLNLSFCDVTLSTKVCLVKAMVSPVVMYGCESWTIKKPECRRIDAFELWCWRRLLRIPWTLSGDQSWVFIGRTDVEAETQLHLAGQPDECFLYLSMYLYIYLSI